MHLLHLVSWFLGGALFANAIPHFVSGMMGRRFPSPFAKPPGKGLSSPTVNLLWGFANLAGAWLLLCRVGMFDVRKPGDVLAPVLGMFLLGLFAARHFGDLHDGNGPG